MDILDLERELDALIARTEGPTRAIALAALALFRTLASGQAVAEREEAERRLQEILDRLPALQELPRRRVLVVEANVEFADAIPHVLGFGFEVVRVADGGAARELLLTDAAFDVVLYDALASVVDGPRFLRWTRFVRPELVKRVLFMTTSPELPTARLVALSHANAVLRKPFSRAVLLESIRIIEAPEPLPLTAGEDVASTMDHYASALVGAYVELRAASQTLPPDERHDAELFKFALLEEMRLAAAYSDGIMASDVSDRARVLAKRRHGPELASWLASMAEQLPRSELWLAVKRRRNEPS